MCAFFLESTVTPNVHVMCGILASYSVCRSQACRTCEWNRKKVILIWCVPKTVKNDVRTSFFTSFSVSGFLMRWISQRFSFAAGVKWMQSPFSTRTQTPERSTNAKRRKRDFLRRIPLSSAEFSIWTPGIRCVADPVSSSVKPNIDMKTKIDQQQFECPK